MITYKEFAEMVHGTSCPAAYGIYCREVQAATAELAKYQRDYPPLLEERDALVKELDETQVKLANCGWARYHADTQRDAALTEVATLKDQAEKREAALTSVTRARDEYRHAWLLVRLEFLAHEELEETKHEKTRAERDEARAELVEASKQREAVRGHRDDIEQELVREKAAHEKTKATLAEANERTKARAQLDVDALVKELEETQVKLANCEGARHHAETQRDEWRTSFDEWRAAYTNLAAERDMYKARGNAWKACAKRNSGSSQRYVRAKEEADR